MRIVRAPRPNRGFLMLRNEVAQDSRLSYRARGVLISILSRPDDWETDAVRLSRQGREGRDAIRASLAELEELGYLVRERRQGSAGKWTTVVTVRDEPDTLPGNPPQQKVNAQVAPETENQASVFQALSRKTETQTRTGNGYPQYLGKDESEHARQGPASPGGGLLVEEQAPAAPKGMTPSASQSEERTTVEDDWDPFEPWVTSGGIAPALNELLRTCHLSTRMRVAINNAQDASYSLQDVERVMRSAWTQVDLEQLGQDDVEALVAAVEGMTHV